MANQDFDINIRVNADTSQVEAIRQSFEKLGAQVQVTNAQVGGGGGGALGSLVGSLAGGIAGGVGVGLIADQLKRYTTELNKATQEIAIQSDKVAALGRSWEEAAKQVLTPEDLRKLASAGMSEFDAIHNRIKAIAAEESEGLEGLGDTVVKGLKNAFTFGGDPGAKGPYEKLREERIKALALDEQQLRQEKIHAIELGETYQDMFDQLKEEPVDEAVGKVGEKVSELETKQRNLNKASQDYLKDYNDINRELVLAERTMNLLLQNERQRKAESEATSKSKQEDVDFVQEQVRHASPQARAILMNEQAAALARDQGRGRDADMFGRTADILKGSATPAQQSETAVLEKLIEQNRLLSEIRDSWR